MANDPQELLLRLRLIADMKDAGQAQAAIRALNAEAAKPVKSGLAGFADTLRDMKAAFQGSGDFGEVLIYNRALNAGDISLLSAYMRSKWGTP
jgi:hypothetical protein